MYFAFMLPRHSVRLYRNGLWLVGALGSSCSWQGLVGGGAWSSTLGLTFLLPTPYLCPEAALEPPLGPKPPTAVLIQQFAQSWQYP